MKRNMILSVVMDILILVLGRSVWSVPPAPVLQEENVEQAFENVMPCTVRIQAGERYGSGSIYDLTVDEMIVVTAGHLISDCREELNITFMNGRMVKGRLVDVSDETDVGFIGISLADLSPEEMMQLRQVVINGSAYETLAKNSCFFMIDIVSDYDEPVYSQGAIVEREMFLPDYGRSMMYGDAYAHPGMSGCGIFDGYGNFVGILSGGTEHNEIAAVSLTDIEEAYRKTQLIPLCKKQFTEGEN